MKKTALSICGPACGLLLLVGVSPPVLGDTSAAAATRPPPRWARSGAGAHSDQASYLFGLVFGAQIRSTGITNEVVMDAINRGLKDGLQGKQPTPADQQQMRAYLSVVTDAALARNQAAAKDFLAHNAQEKGVMTTASGLQYKIIAPGDCKAAHITPTDKVTVQYRGKLIDGSEFDSSYRAACRQPSRSMASSRVGRKRWC